MNIHYLYPPVETSLRERAPEGCSLDTSGAHGFLRETAGALEQSGFGVMLPQGWSIAGDVVMEAWGRWDDAESLAAGVFAALRALAS